MEAEYDDGYQNDERQEQFKHLSEDLGLVGNKRLIEILDEQTLSNIGSICKEMLLQKYISPQDISKLHKEISSEMAESESLLLSLRLVCQKIRNELPSSLIGESEIRQVINGTHVASREALVTLCYVLGTNSGEIISQAMFRSPGMD